MWVVGSNGYTTPGTRLCANGKSRRHAFVRRFVVQQGKEGPALLAALALLLAASPGPAAASPSPVPKTIVNVHVSPLCAFMHSVVSPFLATENGNRQLFEQMDDNIARFLEAAQISDDAGSPGMILARANVDWYSAQAYDNLARIDLLLKSSYERMPKGNDLALDAIRARVQSLIDIERISVNDYASIAGLRTTSYNYWRSTTAEIDQIRKADGVASTADGPPPQNYAAGWLMDEMHSEQRNFLPAIQKMAWISPNSCL
jgi:hypothetical protein